MLPLNLYLVRHGQSEGNVVSKLIKAGRLGEVPPEFRARLTHEWRLTEQGIRQAKAAGEWLAANIVGDVGYCFVSNYVRAQETAGYLLPKVEWRESLYLRERSWGDADHMTLEERFAAHEAFETAQDRDLFHWYPPGGESMAQICIDADRALSTLHRECSEMRNVVMCLHGEKMWTFRQRLEQMRLQRFEELHASKNPNDHIHNCQILHYTRADPHADCGTVRKSYGWMRSICPWDPKLSHGKWQEIVRHRPTGEELLKEVERYPRLVA
jgi:broad specificity phosphatase PhoE